MDKLVIRPAMPVDLPDLRRAVVELQEYERGLHATRLPGEQIANTYVAWLQQQAKKKSGAMMVAEFDGSFAGFAVGWIAAHNHITETTDANRFGYLSDICVMPSYRGQRIAHQLLAAIEQHLSRAGITRLRLGTLAANASARASYESAGFTPYEIIYEKLVGKQDEPGA
jgi:ribosomal protein S18 acetylase RimI-like enzyme